MIEKYVAITAHRDRFAVTLMCRALQVSLSAYDAHVQRTAFPPPTCG